MRCIFVVERTPVLYCYCQSVAAIGAQSMVERSIMTPGVQRRLRQHANALKAI